jgi:hypothetical protein
MSSTIQTLGKHMQFKFLTAGTASLLLMVSAAHATTTMTPYDPSAPTNLSSFGDGNELAAQTVTYQADPNGKGLDVIVQVDPAGAGKDQADSSLGLQFTNLYFGDATNGATIGFELGNSDAFVPGVAGDVVYGSTAGITYIDTPGSSYADGGVGSMSQTYIPYTDFTTSALGLAGFTPYQPGDSLQLRDVQAFSYAGNNAGGDPRFGSVTIPSVSAAPEPASWALMLMGVGGLGGALRLRRKGALAAA